MKRMFNKARGTCDAWLRIKKRKRRETGPTPIDAKYIR